MTRTMTSARGAFAALSYRTYRLWFFGQMTSLVGAWMQSTAQGYRIYELTRSAAYLGSVGCASGIAMWVFTLHGGVIADRVPRRSLFVVTQGLGMLLAVALSALTFARIVAPWHIIVLAFLLGVVNAIAMNSTMFNAAVVAGLPFMRLEPGMAPARRASAFAEIREGLRAVRVLHGEARTNGPLPVGALMAGAIAEKGGAPLAVLFGAGGTLACAAAIAIAVPSLRKAE